MPPSRHYLYEPRYNKWVLVLVAQFVVVAHGGLFDFFPEPPTRTTISRDLTTDYDSTPYPDENQLEESPQPDSHPFEMNQHTSTATHEDASDTTEEHVTAQLNSANGQTERDSDDGYQIANHFGRPKEWNAGNKSTEVFVNQSSKLQNELRKFEHKARAFISNLERVQTTITDSNTFGEEIDQYMSILPQNASKIVVTKKRDKCSCNGAMWSPCPLKCFYSCYYRIPNDVNVPWLYLEDCRQLDNHESWIKYNSSHCKCSNESNSDWGCGIFGFSECIQETTEYFQSEGTCSKFYVDKTRLMGSYKHALTLLVEPLKVRLRGIEYHLTFLREASATIQSLAALALENCQNKPDPLCNSESQLVATEEAKYRQIKTNVTLELIRAQIQIEGIFKQVISLRERIVAQVNGYVKDYACCMKTLDFPVDTLECNSTTTDLVPCAHDRNTITTESDSNTHTLTPEDSKFHISICVYELWTPEFTNSSSPEFKRFSNAFAVELELFFDAPVQEDPAMPGSRNAFVTKIEFLEEVLSRVTAVLVSRGLTESETIEHRLRKHLERKNKLGRYSVVIDEYHPLTIQRYQP